jgi:purine-binding chemotaxis protein CheW
VTRRSCIVVVEVDRAGTTDVVGIIADRVSQVVELPADAIEPAPAFGVGVRTDWLLGLGRTDKRFLLLLDTDRMLSDWDESGELAAQREAAKAEAALQ